MKYLMLISLVFMSSCRDVVVYNGKDGKDGVNGTTVTVQAFCPAIPGAIGYNNRESYLIIGSSVYAVYYDGSHTFLSLLNTGNYVTTDGRDCHFTVSSDGSVL